MKNKQFISILFFSIILLIIDQGIKFYLTNSMNLNDVNVIYDNFFSINLVHNTGAAFSIFSGNRIFLIIIGIIALICSIVFVIKDDNYSDIEIFIYSLLIGGIAGNLVDRIGHGYVIDYLSFKFGSYYFPIFNFADICIVVSVILILISSIKGELWK